MKRRAFVGLAAAAATGGVLGYGNLVEPRRLAHSRYALQLSARGAVEGAVPDGAGPPVRIVQLSDLHLKEVGAVHERLAREVDALDPDLILLTGDTVDDRANVPLLGDFLSLLRSRAALLAILGNWEYQGGVSAEALARELERSGGELLVDRSTRVAARGRSLALTGLDDWLRGSPDVSRALAGLDPSLRELGHHVVLAHCPAHRDALAAQPAADAPLPWVLSGHTHGGQVGVGSLRVTPRGSASYLEGWYRGPLPHIYVSRGIGTSMVPIRIGSPPEVATFDVYLT